jgi:hypothetical protein
MKKSNEIDTDCISIFNIPEMRFIHENSVIGGVRGRTLSAPKRRWVLKKLKEAGIETIIDLREGKNVKELPNARNYNR